MGRFGRREPSKARRVTLESEAQRKEELLRTNGSEMCISEMTVILMSLGSASGEVAELFGRNRFGGAAVDMGFGRGLTSDRLDERRRGPV